MIQGSSSSVKEDEDHRLNRAANLLAEEVLLLRKRSSLGRNSYSLGFATARPHSDVATILQNPQRLQQLVRETGANKFAWKLTSYRSDVTVADDEVTICLSPER